MSGNIEISVLITSAFPDRKELLLGAIKSVLEQDTMVPYEVILIKSYSDTDIEKFCVSNGINCILITHQYIGKKLARGIVESRGELICLLDDDDLFLPIKISTVYKKFQDRKDLVYYHNSFIPIDLQGQLLYKKDTVFQFLISLNKRLNERTIPSLFKYSPDFNNSCISFKKKILLNWIDLLEEIEISSDSFLFYIAIESQGYLQIDSEPLSYYRIHNSSSRTQVATDNLTKKPLSKAYKTYYALYDIRQRVNNNLVKNALDFELGIWGIRTKIHDRNVERREILNQLFFTIRKSKFTFNGMFLFAIFLGVTGIISPNLSIFSETFLLRHYYKKKLIPL